MPQTLAGGDAPSRTIWRAPWSACARNCRSPGKWLRQPQRLLPMEQRPRPGRKSIARYSNFMREQQRLTPAGRLLECLPAGCTGALLAGHRAAFDTVQHHQVAVRPV